MQSIQYVAVAKGEKPAECVIKNAKIVNVFSGEIEEGDIAIENGIIVGIGSYQGKQNIDVKGDYVAPGFIDGHVHIESSMLTPPQFAKIVMPKGTTTIIADPHEIANVVGIQGIYYMLECSENIPLDVYVMVPSCVPATPFETNGAAITIDDILTLKKHPRILGLGEVMDYSGVIEGQPLIHEKIAAMQEKIVDGHCPQVSGKELNAYISPHIVTDHECSTKEEALERIRRGMYVHLREGSSTRNLCDLLGAVTNNNYHRMLFCTDDKHPEDIRKEGHINYNINLATKLGLDPIKAIQMATINIAQCYKLSRVGAIAPSYVADLVVFDDLHRIEPKMVYKKGQLVAKNNQALFDVTIKANELICDTIHIKRESVSFDLRLNKNKVKVIGLVDNNIITESLIEEVTIKNGLYTHDPTKDNLKIAIVERHHMTGNVGLGLLKGFGLKNGAIAMTIAHDSHNLIIVGDNDSDMEVAMDTIIANKGGITVVSQGKVRESLTLEVGGIITTQNVEIVEQKLSNMKQICRDLGVPHHIDDPFLTLAFMSLTVIPELKLSDKGLFDVKRLEIVDIESE